MSDALISYDDVPPPAFDGSEERAPAYERTPQDASHPTVTHLVTLTRVSGDVMRLAIDSHAGTPDQTPLFFNGDTINGTFSLSLASSSTVRSITLQIRGFSRGTTPGHDFNEVFFYRNSLSLRPSVEHGNTPSKLDKGLHTFPFHIDLPKQFTHKDVVFDLPPTFIHHDFPEYIAYDITIDVQRHWLYGSDHLSTLFRYLPTSRARRPSLLRELAYSEHTALLGPEADPDGWATKTNIIKGRIFSQRDISLQCRLSLASPLEYARSCPIPIYLEFRSQTPDRLALDLLANPNALSISLERNIYLGADSSKMSGFGRGEYVELVGNGVCWPSRSQTRSPSDLGRALDGEIILRANLVPPFEFPTIRQVYSVRLRINAVGFVPHGVKSSKQEDYVLFEIPVVITTDRAHGPKPRSYAPLANIAVEG